MKNINRLSNSSLVIMYLAAIVAANVTVAMFGPQWSIVNAFLFIGLNLTSRDRLHDAWGSDLRRNMLLLIVAGAGISALFGAGRIALASAVAFGVSELADAVAYQFMSGKSKKIVQVNGSNVAGAAVDSILFPLLAFGWPPLIPIMLGQFAAKTLGGAVWSIVLFRQGKSTSHTPQSEDLT